MVINVAGKDINIGEEIVSLIRIGKWDSSIKVIMRTYGVKEEIARKIGVAIKEKISKEREEIQERIANSRDNVMVTSGYNFEGYNIKKYLGVINKECVMGTGMLSEFLGSVADLTGGEVNIFSEKIQKARDVVYEGLLNEAIKKNANGIIGMDYEYFALKANMICVCAKGTIVQVEKNN